MIQNIGLAAGGSVLIYGLLRTNTAGTWLSARVEVPVVMLIAMALLIIIPTGDLINTASKWLQYLAPPGDDSTAAGRPASPRQVSQSHRHPNTPRRPVAGDGTHDRDRDRDRTQSQSSAPDGTDD